MVVTSIFHGRGAALLETRQLGMNASMSLSSFIYTRGNHQVLTSDCRLSRHGLRGETNPSVFHSSLTPALLQSAHCTGSHAVPRSTHAPPGAMYGTYKKLLEPIYRCKIIFQILFS